MCHLKLCICFVSFSLPQMFTDYFTIVEDPSIVERNEMNNSHKNSSFKKSVIILH